LINLMVFGEEYT